MSSFSETILTTFKEYKKPIIAATAGASLLTTIVLYNIRKSGPHFKTSRVLSGGLLGSPSVRSGGPNDLESKSERNQSLKTIKSILNDYIINGQDIGTQISIFIDNKETFNHYAVDQNRIPNYNEQSMHTIYSCTKNIAALLTGIAVNKGWIESYDDRVIKYWPKFPTKSQYYSVKDGKFVFEPVENEPRYITIADVLRHEAGLYMFFDTTITFKTTVDEMRNIIENSILRYRRYDGTKYDINMPKTDRSYHGLTRGFLLNEIFRRVEPKNRTMNEYFKQEIVPILSKNDLNFKMYLKGIPKTELTPVIHIENYNLVWAIYHFFMPILLGMKFHLPGSNFFNKYLPDLDYTNFARLMKFVKIYQLPSDHKSFSPEWDTAGQNTKGVSKLFEHDTDIAMEWMSGSGIANAHSMGKLLSHYMFGEGGNDKMLSDITAKPKKAYDTPIFTETNFTQGGFNRVEQYGITWYLWGGIGGSIYAFAPKYKCVFAYTVTGMQRQDLGFYNHGKLFNDNVFNMQPRAKTLALYLAQYLKSL